METNNPTLVIQVLGVDGTWQDVYQQALINSTYTVGRSPDCDIRLRKILDYSLLETISSVQCSLYKRSSNTKDSKPGIVRYIEPGYDCRDGDPFKPSTNGCFYNGTRMIEKVQLRNGDTVRISKAVRLLYSNEASRISEQIEDTLIDPKEASEYLKYLKSKQQ